MRYLLLFVMMTVFAATGQAQTVERSPFSIGETITFKSEVLGEDRVINVYLPAYYAVDSLKNYPVVYLLDGSVDEDFIHIAGLVQFCSFSWINIMPEIIVVGIANIDRKRDFTYPSSVQRDREEFPTTGHSEPFINFIANELQPLISKTYRVTDEKTIIGQSLGGLLATEILIKQPAMFDNYVIVSPSLWWDDEQLLEQDWVGSLADKKIYVGVGKEGEIMERVAYQLYDKLVNDWSENAFLRFGYFQKQDHGDVLHLAAYDAFEQLFGKKKEE